MPIQHATVTIKPDGSVKMEGHNFRGSECLSALKWLREVLGVKEVKMKADTIKVSAQQHLKQ
jgi:hypothetical protein